ncbi:uncharacterized protein LOC119851795 isoform X4 [Dermochelys coriacea]|uniref:uncharacterized protein LOC119851795 isoform X4 n=1 Tax=Dermochelys coriacea TaxID=27794 RepID=UPI001CA8DD2E|nr:uncharacterized protein LOC119851795 isoform X4 [Dermochelys coriacea]
MLEEKLAVLDLLRDSMSVSNVAHKYDCNKSSIRASKMREREREREREIRQAVASSAPITAKLSDENEQLLKKLKRLHRKNQQLENDLAQIQEKLHLEQLMHDCVTSRDVQVQTESHLRYKGAGSHNKEIKVASESARILQMYNNLQKCYDREIKTNQEQSETIKNLTIKIHELEHQLQGQKQRIEQLECKKVSQKENTVSGVRTPTAEREVTLSHRCICKKKGACSCKYLVLLLLEIQKLKKKNDKLSRERRMQRNELPGLDKFQSLRTHS